jgi:hypothetical protein
MDDISRIPPGYIPEKRHGHNSTPDADASSLPDSVSIAGGDRHPRNEEIFERPAPPPPSRVIHRKNLSMKKFSALRP